MRYMLDTNICIYLIKRRPAAVTAALLQHEAEGVGRVHHHGVRAGLWRGPKSASARNQSALRHFLEPLEVADFDHAAAMAYANVRAALEAAGTPIGPLDTQIAAHALSLGITLVSNNTREFERVPGLKLANWAKQGASD